MVAYTNDILVSPEWVKNRLDDIRDDDPALRLFEVSVDTDVYAEGHIPGAFALDWNIKLQDPKTFDVPPRDDFETLLGSYGVTPDTTVILYGDMKNWFAAYAYWLLKYYGHEDVRLVNGGREYWIKQSFPLSTERPSVAERTYTVTDVNDEIRVDRETVRDALNGDVSIVDVRSPEEYRGEVLAPPGWNEGVQRGGHIPGAINIPWNQVVREDGQFKSLSELQAVYKSITDTGAETIVYCRIGERSALAWVVLHELLGYECVRHYYGSWVEWGNTVGAPIEQGRYADAKPSPQS
ncbi:thiosulfate sulfurtransferase [Haladaptatus paucihalophilus DX253]|uniref:Thiosulfate sulfurtransferase n=1 Tax=Haladaptatus paucihalophilus DX253 TaxID=797209 RepID=E7QSZ4_HALPU|nr:sulfurtransferase [Haladaptatus paucihalophilus]EFW92275.1 thiosulfate sulfurtransferase [Haladaptatus paucihalophilus DX253]SHL62261.1 thiosulfate/3-mercaptopyruvate sulfurtransferase [Haladaptatus paucihalophilus DX253]